ncbi:peptidase M16 inactive domain-containing protein [Chytriomyces sp. MP71]|nr:peptidase M16 inactive domain-containing protein [Chytriomyces sp. MP71]
MQSLRHSLRPLIVRNPSRWHSTASSHHGDGVTVTGGGSTFVSILSNGVTVASSEASGHFASVGVIVDAGSACEDASTRGCLQVLERMAFKGEAWMQTAIEGVGSQVTAHGSRESLLFSASVFHKHASDALRILASAVRDPVFDAVELDGVKEQLAYELDVGQWNYMAVLPERMHSIAFGNKLTGLDRYAVQSITHAHDIPSLCTPTSFLGNSPACDNFENLQNISPRTLSTFHKKWVTPNRIAVTAVGIPHAELLALAEREFGSIPAASPDTIAAQTKFLASPAPYKGGIVLVDTTGMPTSPNPDDRLLTHVNIAFEAPGMLDPDVYALATLASLMGGGGSFSAGGPGKGMYTRLYTEVLNRYHWVENCNMLSYSYAPTSLFGIAAAVPPTPETHAHILPILLSHLHTTTQPDRLSSTALARARNQLKSNLLMSLESRPVEMEDLARQVVAQAGVRVGVREMCARIDAVEPEDVARVARRVFMGSEEASPLEFGGEGVLKPWKRSGDSGPTVLVHGPLFGERDAFWGVDERVREWGLGGDLFARLGSARAGSKTVLGGRKGLGSKWFGRQFR